MRERREIVGEVEALRARSIALGLRCDELAHEVFQLRGLLVAAETKNLQLTADAEHIHAQLMQSRSIISLMERSWFWRARLLWVRMRRLVLAAHLL